VKLQKVAALSVCCVSRFLGVGEDGVSAYNGRGNSSSLRIDLVIVAGMKKRWRGELERYQFKGRCEDSFEDL